MKLSSDEFKQLHEALLDAFPTLGALTRMARLGLGLDLNTVTGATGSSFADNIFDLIRWAESRDSVNKLVTEAAKDNDGNHKLQAVARKMGVSPHSEQHEVVPYSAPTNGVMLGALPPREHLVLAIAPNLTLIDNLILFISGNQILAENTEFNNLISDRELIRLASTPYISVDTSIESLENLEEHGYITVTRFLGPYINWHYQFTIWGFAQYSYACISKYQELEDCVITSVINWEGKDSFALASKINQSHMLVKHILRYLATKNLIDVMVTTGVPGTGLLVHVETVSHELRNRAGNLYSR